MACIVRHNLLQSLKDNETWLHDDIEHAQAIKNSWNHKPNQSLKLERPQLHTKLNLVIL